MLIAVPPQETGRNSEKNITPFKWLHRMTMKPTFENFYDISVDEMCGFDCVADFVCDVPCGEVCAYIYICTCIYIYIYTYMWVDESFHNSLLMCEMRRVRECVRMYA